METVVLDMSVQNSYDKNLSFATDLLTKGNIVAFPTETVYGLGGIISKEETFNQIYSLKGRPLDNPLIVHCSTVEQLYSLCFSVSTVLKKLVSSFMPGPLTVVTKKAVGIPNYITSGLDTVALRIPSNKVALDLIERVGEPIAAPSANISGKPSPTAAKHVFDDFNGRIPLILDDGQCEIGIESTVLFVEDQFVSLLRPGTISIEIIETVLQSKINIPTEKSVPTLSPGMKYRHYSPNAIITLVYTGKEAVIKAEKSSEKVMILLPEEISYIEDNYSNAFYYSEKNIYSLFRKADSENYSEIIIFVDQSTIEKMGLYNRIKKASSK